MWGQPAGFPISLPSLATPPSHTDQTLKPLVFKDRFEVERTLDGGGMGIIYLASTPLNLSVPATFKSSAYKYAQTHKNGLALPFFGDPAGVEV